MLNTIFFDLDDTLYPRGSQLMSEIGRRITEFIVRELGMSPERATALRKHWRETYGTALRGMSEEGYVFDRERFFQFVHDVPLDGLIRSDPEVRAMLLELPLRRAVLTNSNVEHARRVLRHIELEDCFERIIDIRALDYVNKPYPEAFLSACELMGVEPTEAILVEDTPVNTVAARDMGMATVLVDCPDDGDADIYVSRVSEVGRAVALLLARDAERASMPLQPVPAVHHPAIGEPPDES